MHYIGTTWMSESALSAEWAVQGFAARLGTQLSPEMLFGLGRSACYRLAGSDTNPALQVLASGCLMNMFSALNVPVEVYDILCTRELAPRDLDFANDRRVLFLAKSSALESSGGGRSNCTSCETEYVWVTRCGDRGSSQWPQLLVTRESTGEKVMEGASFAQAMAMNIRELTRYMLWIPSGRSITWHPKVVLEYTLVRYVSELSNSGTQVEPNGLAALEYLIKRVQAGTLQEADLPSTILSGRNPYAYRDYLARFFDEAFEVVRDHLLKGVAVLYQRVARLWARILVPGAAFSPAIVEKTLGEILSNEQDALHLLQRCVARHA